MNLDTLYKLFCGRRRLTDEQLAEYDREQLPGDLQKSFGAFTPELAQSLNSASWAEVAEKIREIAICQADASALIAYHEAHND